MALPRTPRLDVCDDGIVTIVGREPRDVAECFGHHQATAYPRALFTALASATGHLAATLGPTAGCLPPDDPRVQWDLDVRRLRFAEHGRRVLRGMPDEVRAWVDGFAAGVERARRALRATDPDPVLDRLTARPVTPATIAALDYRVASHHELGRLDAMRRGVAQDAPRASNAIAVARERARDADALLLIDPHIPLSATPELRLLPVRLRTRGYCASGVARLGNPLVFLGFSRHVGWAITTNWPDTLRWFVLRRRGDAYDEVKVDRAPRRRIARDVAIDIVGRRPHRATIEFAGSLARPVWCGLSGGRRLAVSPSVATAGDVSTQLYRAATVRTARAFRRRVLATRGAACTNFVVADRDGRIGCAWYGRVPKIGGGYLDSVRDLPWDDGGADGYVVQNNAHFDRVRPSIGTSVGDYPVRVADGVDSVTSFRQERCIGRLRAGPVDAPALLRLAIDPHDGRVACFVRTVGRAVASRPGAPRHGEALDRLGRWRGRFTRGSREATLAAIWFERTLRHTSWPSAAWQRPDFVPDRIHARAADVAMRTLGAAWSVWCAARRPRWGDVHTLTVGAHRLPVAGYGHANRCTTGLGAPDLDPETLAFPVEAGGPALIVVRFAGGAPSARALFANGPTEDPDAPEVLAAASRWARDRTVELTLVDG